MVQLEISKAKPLFVEVLQACRERLGDLHPGTLTSISNMGFLLKDMGQLEEAKPLYEEALRAKRETLGNLHPSTLASIINISALL